jgi:dTDP-4-amino-4,6-dideoxygalactose transaminase
MGALTARAWDRSDEDLLGAAFAEFVGQPHATPVSGARAGLWYILQWLKETRGTGEVIVPALTASIVPNVVAAAGFDVQYCDVHPERFTSGPEEILPLVNGRTRAVIATHLEGFPVRADQLRRDLGGAGVFLIEDVAHAPGAQIGDERTGSLGDASVFSLGKGKHLNALDGGILATRDPELFAWVERELSSLKPVGRGSVLKKMGLVQSMVWMTRRPLFDVGLWPSIRFFAKRSKDPLYDHFLDSAQPLGPEGPASAGWRLNAFQCRLAVAALEGLEAQLVDRVGMHARFSEAAGDRVVVQRSAQGTSPAPLEFVVRAGSRWDARVSLWEQGVDSQATWMQSPDMLPAFADRKGAYPVAESLARELLYLPFYPGLIEAERARIEEILFDPPAGLCP